MAIKNMLQWEMLGPIHWSDGNAQAGYVHRTVHVCYDESRGKCGYVRRTSKRKSRVFEVPDDSFFATLIREKLARRAELMSFLQEGDSPPPPVYHSL